MTCKHRGRNTNSFSQARVMYIFATFVSLVLNVILLLVGLHCWPRVSDIAKTMKWMARIYVWMGPACYMLCALATIAGKSRVSESGIEPFF